MIFIKVSMGYIKNFQKGKKRVSSQSFELKKNGFKDLHKEEKALGFRKQNSPNDNLPRF